MKKNIVLAIFLVLFFVLLYANSSYALTMKTVQAKNPYISNSIRPAIAKYNAQNYVGAMQDLESVLSREPRNAAGHYYLALTYTKLGKVESAKSAYEKVVQLESKDSALAAYSQYALLCTGNSDGCTKNINNYLSTLDELKKSSKMVDMAFFIESGQKIHPAAMDKITNERMIRKTQEFEYSQKNKSN